MFVLSELLEHFFPELGGEPVHERPFRSLGLLSYHSGEEVLSFIDDPRYMGAMPEALSMLLLTEELKEQVPPNPPYGIFVCENPRRLFFALHNLLCDFPDYALARRENHIAPSAVISPMAFIADHNVEIGENVVVEAFATIYANVSIGDDCVVRSGARIGGEGFEFKRGEGEMMAVRHAGRVKLEREVEIQNNSCVDRAIYPWDSTEVGERTKIDNLVHVGHAVKLGKNILVAALAVLGGRATIGDRSWIGVGTVLRNGIAVGADARVNMGAVVSQSVADGEAVTGNFAIPHERFIEQLKRQARREG